MNGAALGWMGLVAGLAALVAGAWMLRVSLQRRPQAAAERLTSTWRLAELGAPLVVARDVEADVPAGARVVVSGQVAPEAFAAAQVRAAPHVPGEYAVDAARGRALLFLGGVRAGALALPTDEPALVARLAADAEALWARAEPYVERRSLGDVAGRVGLAVETQGTVADVLPYHGAFLLRLEDGGDVVGVQVDREPTELKGQRVLVRGTVGKDKGGYPVLKATDLRRLE